MSILSAGNSSISIGIGDAGRASEVVFGIEIKVVGIGMLSLGFEIFGSGTLARFSSDEGELA
jgi:hypothetical protein